MRSDEHLLLVHLLLDMQLIDSDGVRCGRVDDVELSEADPPRVTGLLSGAGVVAGRLPGPMRTRLRRIFVDPQDGENVIRVPWSQVSGIEAVVRLRRPAAELGLGRGDDVLRAVAQR